MTMNENQLMAIANNAPALILAMRGTPELAAAVQAAAVAAAMLWQHWDAITKDFPAHGGD
jgi:hypothetical protein